MYFRGLLEPFNGVLRGFRGIDFGDLKGVCMGLWSFQGRFETFRKRCKGFSDSFQVPFRLLYVHS